MCHYNSHYQSYIENGDYTNEHGFTHIPCPVCTSKDCIHFDTEFLDIDFQDNTCQASDLCLYSSLIDDYEDENTFRITMYNTAIDVCGLEYNPKLSNPKLRNLFNVFFRNIKAYQYYMGLHENCKKNYRSIHNLNNEIMCKVYVIIYSIFLQVFRLEDYMKILKRLDVTQLKLVFVGELLKPNWFMQKDFRGITFQHVPIIFPDATDQQIRRYPNNFTNFELQIT